jgi:hypothetical protein
MMAMSAAVQALGIGTTTAAEDVGGPLRDALRSGFPSYIDEAA